MRSRNRKTVLLLSIATGALVGPACGGATTNSGEDQSNVDDSDSDSDGTGGTPVQGAVVYPPGLFPVGTGGAGGARPYVPGTGGFPQGTIPYPPGGGAPGLVVGLPPYPPGTGGVPGIIIQPPDGGVSVDGGGAPTDAAGDAMPDAVFPESDGGPPDLPPPGLVPRPPGT